MDYTHSSRKIWSLLRKFGAAQPSRIVSCVSATNIASTFFKTPNIKSQKSKKIDVRREIMEEIRKYEEK